MDRQEIFQRVATHLLTQNSRSMQWGSCAYRGRDNRKCAVGALITDDAWRTFIAPNLNTSSVMDDGVMQALLGSGVSPLDPGDQLFLRDLQRIHDCTPVEEWLTALVAFAGTNSLDASFLTETV